MSVLEGTGLRFKETMSGHLGIGATDPTGGLQEGREQGAAISFEADIVIDDLERFVSVSSHRAELRGTVTFGPLGGTFPMRGGRFNLFTIDPATGTRRMIYRFCFTGADGQTYFLNGHKVIEDDPHRLDAVEDMTRLFTTVHRGENATAPIYGAGELYFNVADAPALTRSIEITGDVSPWQQVAARLAFASFAFGALRSEYLKPVRLLYEARYENLVLSGRVRHGRVPRPFFMVCGEHEEGFPWGDGEAFWDVLLAVGRDDGGWDTYGITDRVLTGLQLDVPGGTLRYRGPLFEVPDGRAGFTQMRASSGGLTRCEAELTVDFDAAAQGTASYPFPLAQKLCRKMTSPLRRQLRDVLPSEHDLGVHITAHAVSVRAGRIEVGRRPEGDAEARAVQLDIDPSQTFGEAERGTFRNLNEPTLLYGYLCALDPSARRARVQIHTRTLRNEREDWAKDRLDAFLGEVLSRTASGEYVVRDDGLEVHTLNRRADPAAADRLLAKMGDPILEINNDHYPTAIFQRRIVKVRDPDGAECLALEEDMSLMRLEAVNSDRRVPVASVRHPDKHRALERVLDQGGFFPLLERSVAESGKSWDKFSVAIKPNFMFSYDRNDRTTYTDPQLVRHLAMRLKDMGVRDIAVVEAQSTYGQYFDRRSVDEMADYLAFRDPDLYRIVDMTEEAANPRDMGPVLGEHPVPPTWANADFRISFAKNKTHAYAYYTLNLKNIYGCLPFANKFREYHCKRDIYRTAIDWLAAFPVHFALVDAHLSADGPFGVFSDTRPNETQTIIGGPDPVAVDWVAASKMGIDPMLSRYMSLAVERFGKPEIDLVGDPNPYRPWLNVPAALTLFTHKGLDASYHFGNLLYLVSAQMDQTHFSLKNNAFYVRFLRKLTDPLRQAVFLRTGENPTLMNRALAWVLYHMGY